MNAKEKLKLMLEQMDEQFCYTKYLAVKSGFSLTHVANILNTMEICGEVHSRKFKNRKIYFLHKDKEEENENNDKPYTQKE